ncbi:hypothetical protein EBT31_09835 [bacterium]|jgi:hypothetical protein|nr:hypothetical protein [bacterium]NBX51464.1 hypothetical protein [bacterium]
MFKKLLALLVCASASWMTITNLFLDDYPLVDLKMALTEGVEIALLILSAWLAWTGQPTVHIFLPLACLSSGSMVAMARIGGG